MSSNVPDVDAPAPPPTVIRSTADLVRAAVSGWLGTALEFMDFQLYSLAAALVFNEIFFSELGLKAPDHYLDVDTSSLGRVLGEVLIKTEQVLLEERPDAVLPTLGGQTALNLAMELYERKVIGRPGTPEMIGANATAIATAEDREQSTHRCSRDRNSGTAAAASAWRDGDVHQPCTTQSSHPA